MYRLAHLRLGLLSLVFWALTASPGVAQWQNGGAVGGQVLDAQGAPVVHAALRVQSCVTGTSYSLSANAQGRFLLPELAPGLYRIRVEAPGYAVLTQENIVVVPQKKEELTFHLIHLAGALPGTMAAAGLASIKPSEPLVVILRPMRKPLPSRAELAARRAVPAPAPVPAQVLPMSRVLAGLQHQSASEHLVEQPLPPMHALLASRVAERFVSVAARNAQQPTQMADVATPKFVPSMLAPPVHARIEIRTPQGTVKAMITEHPSVLVAQTAGAATISSPTESGPASPQTSHSGVAQTGQEIPPVPALDESMQVGPSTEATASATEKTLRRPTASGLRVLEQAFAPSATQAKVQKVVGSASMAATVASQAQEVHAATPETSTVTLLGSASEPTPEALAALASLNPTVEATGAEPFSAFRPTRAELRGQTPESEREADDALTVVTPERVAQIHGQVFVEDRDSDWGAQNAFTRLTEQTAAGSFITTPYKPPDRQLQAGLELGGAMANRALHWFLAVDALERNDPGMAVASEPSKFFASLTSAQLSTLTARLGLASTDEAQEEYQQAIGSVATMLGSVSRSTHQWIAFPRIDWNFDARNRISIGYDWIRLRAWNGVQAAPTETWGIGSFGTRRLSLDALSGERNSFLSSELLNQLRYTVAHDEQSQLTTTPTAFEEQFAKNTYGLPPEVSLASYSGGFRFGTPSYLDKSRYPDELRQEAADTLTWEHGRSQINLGYALQYVRDQVAGMSYATGAYRYSTRQAFVADLLNPNHCDASTSGVGNLPCWQTFEQTVGPNSFTFNTADYAGFATLTQRAGPSLTLSAGARYDYEHLPNPNAKLVNPAIPQTASLPTGGNLSPRVGFAWALPWLNHHAGAATVLRGGVGIFYARIPNTAVYSAISQTGVASAERNYIFKPLDIGVPAFPYVFSSNPDIQIAPNATYFARGYRHPQATETEFSIEQSLGRNTTLTAGYWGSFASHLPRIVDENIDVSHVASLVYTVVDPNHEGPLSTGRYISKFFYRRLNTNYQQLAAMQSEVNARYQAFGITLKSRLQHEMTLLLSYRNAHTLDGNPYSGLYDGYWNVLDPSDLALDWGASNLDIRNRVRGDLVLREPWVLSGWRETALGGYTLSLAGGFASGRPYTMRSTGAVPSFSCSYQEWLQSGEDCVESALPGVIVGSHVAISALGDSLNGAGGAEWIAGVGRNTYRYPSTFNGNLSFMKQTSLGSHKRLEFGAQVTNFMNHKNITRLETAGYSIRGETADTGVGRLTYLDGGDGYSQFGEPTTSNNNAIYRDRQIEIVLRLLF